MKKVIILTLLMVLAIGTRAADYTYLTFETTDGGKVSVEASSLTLSISGTTLTAGSQTFTISNLSKMYFSTTDESSTTGIEALTTDALNDITEVYDLNGRKVSKDQMQRGVYVVKSQRGTYKIAVK